MILIALCYSAKAYEEGTPGWLLSAKMTNSTTGSMMLRVS